MTPDTVAGALSRHGYLPDEGISTAVFLAMTLHRPLLLEGELMQLADDIRAHGLQQPVVVQQGVLLDGRNRLEACGRAGIEDVPSVEYHCTDPVGFIIGANVRRRNLSISQRAMVAHSLANLPAHRPGNTAACLRHSGLPPQSRHTTRAQRRPISTPIARPTAAAAPTACHGWLCT